MADHLADDIASAARASAPGEWSSWEAAVTDTGEATARALEKQNQEPDQDPQQQQIAVAAQWNDEAEDAGEKLSGGEVGPSPGGGPAHWAAEAR
jgi:hypothetical protein